jgi:hypothetical protein
MSFTQNLETQSVAWLVKTVKLAQNCQKANGMSHPLNATWSEAINACSAEMARRVKAGDREAMAAKL